MSKLSPKPRYFLNLVLIWSIIILFFTFLSYFNALIEREKASFFSIFNSNFTRYGLMGILSHFIFKLTSKFDFQVPPYWKNICIQFILGIIFSTIHFALFGIISSFTSESFKKYYPDFLTYVQNAFLGSFYLGFIFYGLIIFASQAFLRNKKYIEEQQKASTLQAQLVQSQLQALKMQLQPHFLFNTLNSISSLVLKNPPQAQMMIAKLGDFLRLTLDFNENQMVLLSEELRFLRSYLEIEQIRFSEKLQVIFNVDDDVMNAVVSHLALQPIVENSVKHGISQLTEGGKIEIAANKIHDKLQLQVKDNGPGKTAANDKNQTGLSNIKTRLKHLYGEDFNFEMNRGTDGGMTVTITIPLSFDFTAVEKNGK